MRGRGRGVAGWPLRGHTQRVSASKDPEDQPIAGLVVPDDASALDGDRWKYYEELRRRGDIAHAPDGATHTDHPSRWREGLPWFGAHGSRWTPVMFMALAVAAMLASLMLGMVGRADAPVQTQPLSATTVPVGQIGGLLPSAEVKINGSPRQLRDVRPAILAVLPAGDCLSCSGGVGAAVTQGDAAGLRTLVTSTDPAPESAASLALRYGIPLIAAPADTFATYEPVGLTLLVVGPDGVVLDVVRDAGPGTDLSDSLQQAATPAA